MRGGGVGMKSYVWVTFGFLAVAYYQISDGADFKPGDTGITVFAEVDPLIVQEMARESAVSRMALVDNASLAPSAAELADPNQREIETAVMSAIRSQESADIELPVADGAAIRLAVTLPSGEADAPAADLRRVNGSRVNLREGPGTGFGVIGQLSRGTSVEVLEDGGAGWVRLQVMPSGPTGWKIGRAHV